jgi:hypothetical protein
LSYFDTATGKSVLIAELKDSHGQLLPTKNQVLYPDAFTDFKCSVRYTYTKAGFEQDIILEEQPPSPKEWSLNPETTKLQVLTEFLDPPAAEVSRQTGTPGASDKVINFGQMRIGQGKAFLTGTETGPAKGGIAVEKHWQKLDGRDVLVEEVPIPAIAPQLLTLPLPQPPPASGQGDQGSAGSILHRVLEQRHLPPPKLAKHSRQSMRLASLPAAEKGLVLDYFTLSADATNFTFQGDTTYLVNGIFNLDGTTTIEGGTVVKFGDTNVDGVGLWIFGPLVCKTGPYRPGVFTSKHDNSVGETIAGSSGNPTTGTNNFYLLPASTLITNVSNLRFAYAHNGLCLFDNGELDVWDCQFIKCQSAIDNYAFPGFHLHNVLFSGGSTAVQFDQNIAMTLSAEHVTADSTNFWGYSSYQPSLFLTNCIIKGTFTTPPTLSTNSVVLNPAGTVFQTLGAASYYLADNSPWRNAGTTNISTNLLADLKQKTTYPPIVYAKLLLTNNLSLFPQAQRDTDNPDLGYHYDPLDYAFGGAYITTAAITVSPGTAIAGFGTNVYTYGLTIANGGQFLCQGSPTNLNRIVSYNTVQEQSTTNWHTATDGLLLSEFLGNVPACLINCRLTDWSIPAQDGSLLHAYNGQCAPITLQDCQFHGGSLFSDYPTINLTNCLLERVNVVLASWDNNLASVRNNLFWAGTFVFDTYPITNAVVKDNLFDHTTIPDESWDYLTYDGGYNAYVTNCDRLLPFMANDLILTNSPAYQIGALGNYYLPTNSPLINAGSATADLVGMYEYTTTANEVKETNSIVDIGFHYVAVDVNNNPDSTLWLGMPDYLVDANGDGYPDLANWQMNYFGHLGLDPNAMPYGNSITLLQDYQSGNDLSLIDFSLSVSNLNVSTSQTPLSLSVAQGIPYYMAVLIDSTNFDAASWQSFSLSRLVNLGALEGWHDIWIGLRALPQSSASAWRWTRLKLDLTPPPIVIAGPSNVVSQRIIQLTGYSPESLSRITYDLANTNGLLTNQQVHVLDRVLDTNIWEFTTNTLQAFDVELALGTNTFTFHAIDLAGNIGSTNLTISLIRDTTPPIITLGWPQNGMQLCGTSFTLVGSMDDSSATIAATFVDATGGTVALNGLIERDGTFWVEGLPLNAGVNQFTLTATDDWGNVSTTNLSVTQNALTLTVNSVDPEQLYLPANAVSGTVSDPTYSIWVNGVAGVNNGDGTWSAANVPVTAGGTACFYVSAYPAADVLSPSVHQPNGNPSDPNAASALVETAKSPRIYVSSYTASLSGTFDERLDFVSNYSEPGVTIQPGDWSKDHLSADSTITWTDGTGGHGDDTLSENGSDSYSDPGSGSMTCTTHQNWPAPSFWPDLGSGTLTSTPTGCNPANPASPRIVKQHMIYHYKEDPAYIIDNPLYMNQVPFYFATVHNTATITSIAKMKLFTGGKASVKRKSIWKLTATATEDKPPTGFLYAYGIWNGTQYEQKAPIPARSITMGDLGQLDPDGVLYYALENGITKDVTPTVSSVEWYDFGCDAHPYPMISSVYCLAASDANSARTTLGVGEYVGITGLPAETHWTTTAGSVSPADLSSVTLFTAPSNATSATVTARVRKATASNRLYS